MKFSKLISLEIQNTNPFLEAIPVDLQCYSFQMFLSNTDYFIKGIFTSQISQWLLLPKVNEEIKVL